MQRKIIYFINPVSGIQDKATLLKMIEEKTRQRQVKYEIEHTNPQGNYFYLKDKIDAENITDIVVCGGDGTVNQIASALIDIDINVGIIPVGSGNGLALAAKIPKQIDKAIDLIFTGKASYIDAFFINDKFSCMLCGLGFDALVAHEFAKQPKRGLATYVKQTAIHFITAEPYTFELTSMGKSFSTQAYFICIANSNQFGNQVTIAPQASLNDGLLDIVVAQSTSKPKLLWEIIKQVRKGKVQPNQSEYSRQKDILYFQTDKLIINNLSMAPLHIDGEPASTGRKFIIETIPGAFRLIQPVA
ncbi:diacylglycerol/lipid kinase family protein [Ferruginibacter albus]|uniref:diacylglycerol/lipid kinase family protein n=1 Tax=Ferruginibacter albus TaxID=2875540 RepID=UPI001CC40655|nr:YegS/Rv2252/BmrU family lipid kinase [Ferruginibacter albus]UAY52259.1 YegS/Rv2252/BmrU family lipid kinase [Ferruginibacter albus]